MAAIDAFNIAWVETEFDSLVTKCEKTSIPIRNRDFFCKVIQTNYN